jgi:hypothetical protein
MSDDDDDATTARTFGAGSDDRQRQSANRINELLRRLSDGQLDLAAVGQELLTFARESAGGYLDGLKAAGDEHRQALRDLNRSYGDHLFDRLLSGRGPGGQVSAAAEHWAEIALTAPVGGEASAVFVVENAQSFLAEITFLVSEFVDMSGQEPFRPPLRIDPPRLALRPEEEAEVTIRLPLLAELFIPGRLYRATVTVRGQDLKLVLHALAYEPTDHAAAPPDAKSAPDASGDPPSAPRRPRRASRSAAGRTAAPRARKPRGEAAAGGDRGSGGR